MTNKYRSIEQRRLETPAFTLVEMLIAMAVTLLMMAAVARSFSFVGERVRDSRATLQLSAEMLDLTTRLRNELELCTVSLEPNQGGPDQAGYFLYYEGPTTDVTSSLFRAATNPDDATITDLLDSRYGDFDDYLAFTAVAPANSWFTGKVPRYLLDQRAAGSSYVLPSPPYDDDPTTAIPPDPFAPIVIRSKYAEIIYFASPEYDETAASWPQNPAFIDVDGDTDLGSGTAIENGFPDRLRLHRRVLLIRPDLNDSTDLLPIQTRGTGPSVNFMQADTWPTGTTATITSGALDTDAWLYGLAGIHQQCDLSIRRSLLSNGLPSNRVAANTLEDLSKPHNRFAHVRVPFNVLSGAGSATSPTSMPVLALGAPATIFNAINSTSIRIAPVDNTSVTTAPVVTPYRLSGCLRPEFVLGTDRNHFDIPNGLWGADRLGEDLVVNNLLGFDLKIYDPQVTSFTTLAASGGLVVGPNDAGYREELLDVISSPVNTTGSRNRGEIRGAFVDLAYPVLAGGSVRGWQARLYHRLSATSSSAIGTVPSYLATPFSGVDFYAGAATANNAYVNSLYRSGRIWTTGTGIRLFQPAFDTYTSFYERDGFLQSRLSTTSEGTLWSTTTGPAADDGTDGIDGSGIIGGGQATLTGLFGADDLSEHETQPPFLATPEAIQITIRLENPASRHISQSTVVHRARP